MGQLVAIGAEAQVAGFALAGVRVSIAECQEAVWQAWRSLGAEVEVVILSRAAAAVLGQTIDRAEAPLTVVMPG